MILYYDVMLRYYTSVDPDALDDQTWAQTIAILESIREKEAK